MSILFITDSASDFLPPYPANLQVLPMSITFGECTYLDGVELSHHEFYRKLASSGTMPTTSQINPAQFSQAFHQAVEAGRTVICVTISSKLSGTYQSACIAAADFPGQVYVVDSLNAAMGERILVERGLALAETGLSAEEIAAQLDREKTQIRLVALVDTLEYLKRGGRLSAGVAFVGGLLNIKPVITVRDGEVAVLGKARGSKNGNNLLVAEIEKAGGVDFTRPYLLAYSGTEDTMLQTYIHDSRALWEGHTEDLPIVSIGGTIGTHIGPGAVGVSFFSGK